MNRFSHIAWYEWVLYVLSLLVAFSCLNDGLKTFSVHREQESPLLPLYISPFLLIIHLCELLGGACCLAGIGLLLFRKRLGWFLALYGSTVMAFILFEPFFEFGLHMPLLWWFWFFVPVTFACVLLVGQSRTLYAIRPVSFILTLSAGLLTGCLFYKALPVSVYLLTAFD